LTNPHADHKYIDAFRNDDFRLLDELYESNAPQVKRWILKNSGSIEDAKDIFQETIMVIIKKAYDPDFVLTYPIGGLIFKIAKFKWTDQLRKKKTTQKVRNEVKDRLIKKEEDFSLVIEAFAEEEIKQKKLDLSFEQLSDRCKSLLRMVIEGKKPAEIVNSLKMNNLNTVYRRKNACLQRWKELFNAL